MPIYVGDSGIVKPKTNLYAGHGGIVKPRVQLWAGHGGLVKPALAGGLSFVPTDSGAVASGSPTFSNLNIGDPDPSRVVVVVGACWDVSVGRARTISITSIQGISATTVESDASCVIALAPVPTGTTANIVTNTQSGTDRTSIGVFAVYDMADTAAHDTDVDNGGISVAVPQSGLVVAGAVATFTLSLSGIEEVFNLTLSNYNHRVGAEIYDEAGTANISSHGQARIVGASWL